MKLEFQLFLVALLLPPSFGSPTHNEVVLSNASECNCTGTKDGGKEAKTYVCHDSRLGPKVLPKKLPLRTLTADYDRFGGLTPGEFLAKWTSPEGNYIYPPQNGFQLDVNGNAINGSMILRNGTLVDRFGSEFGSYISAADAPYSQRALPPSNLDTNPSTPDYPYNYHMYRVIKDLTVVGGPIAQWFGQPGLGTQFYTGGTANILTLINAGYLIRVNASNVGGGGREGCF